MALETITVTLRAWHPEGKRISPSAFLDKLIFAPGDTAKQGKGPGVPRVELLSLTAGDFSLAEEPSEAFAGALRDGFILAAKWLRKQSSAVFRELRKAGLVTDVFIGAWIDMDQIDLDLPPEFLKACGKHGLKVSLITND
jgi:hypothetical protein